MTHKEKELITKMITTNAKNNTRLHHIDSYDKATVKTYFYGLSQLEHAFQDKDFIKIVEEDASLRTRLKHLTVSIINELS